MRVAEFFSGVGGWHFALQRSEERTGQIGQLEEVHAFEINIHANRIYQTNFPEAKIHCKDIAHLPLDHFARLRSDVWVLSPPCQPYTSLGKQQGADDPRAAALHHLCRTLSALPDDRKPRYICMENVPGFYHSQSHTRWIEALQKAKYHYTQFLLSPTQIEIPNERIRYFCVARLDAWTLDSLENHNPDELLTRIPGTDMVDRVSGSDDSQFYQGADHYTKINTLRSEKYFSHCKPLSDYLLSEWREEDLVPTDFTKRCSGYKHDIVTPQCRRSSCITSGYTTTARGAGSLLLDPTAELSDHVMNTLPQLDEKVIQEGRIRFFHPREVARLMGFPEHFQMDGVLDESRATKQQYKLLGNSINVELASRLIDFLFSPN